MKKRHGARSYNAATGREAAPLHNVEPFTQFFHELCCLQEIIAIIGIAHNDIFPSSCKNSAHEGTAISSLSYVDQAGPELRRDNLTPIRATVIGDDDFSCYFLFI